MATEPQPYRMQLDADPRLAAAVGGVARFLADAAGLESDAIAQLQSAVLAASLEAFEHLPKAHPHLNVALTRFPDRIEVALSLPGESSPAIGLDTIAGLVTGSAAAKSAPNVFAGVDRIQYETHGDETVTLLTKYIREVTPRV